MVAHTAPELASFGNLNSPLPDGSYAGVGIYSTVRIKEMSGRTGSDTRSSATAERVFLLSNVSDPLAAQAALENGPILIDTYGGLSLAGISHERIGPDSWEFTCNYDSFTPDIGGYTVSIDTTGGAILQTYAYSQTKYNASGETGNDWGNLIDVQDGKPQGVQRVIPASKINIRAKIATEYISSPIAYSRLISRLTGYTNSAEMFGAVYKAEELLFIGATGDIIGKNPELTFSFLGGENITGLTIGSITGIAKKAHDYLWFDFKRAKDSSTNRLTSEIRAAYVGKVYSSADLSLLKIGEAPT